MGQRCRKSIAMAVVFFLVFGLGSIALGSEEDLRKELEILKQKVAELEAKLEQPKMETSSETEDGTKEKPSLADEMRPHLAEIRKEIEEKLGLEIHGGVVPFYQGAAAGKINGKNINDPSGAGLGANLELTWKPWLPAFENGRFFMRAHYGDGCGADKKLGDKLFANLNTIADDSATEIAGDRLNLLEAYYAHEFFDGKLVLAVGKTEPLVFIDTNAFANDENSQFVGKPFVNNPILDSEDEYAPIMAASLSPIEGWTISAAGVSTSRPHAPGKQQKSVYDNIFDNPVVAGQLTYSPKFGDLQGNYSLYGWNALYDHPKLLGKGSEKGWGIGLSFDQQVTEKIGLFTRVGYSNDKVYDVDWFWSGGANFKGMIPCRENDELGLGVAGLKASDDFDYHGVEWHTEAYYRIFFTEHFAVSPDFQFVANPQGNSKNDKIYSWMLRGEFTF